MKEKHGGDGGGLGALEPREGGTGNRVVRMHNSLEVDFFWVPGVPYLQSNLVLQQERASVGAASIHSYTYLCIHA